MFSGVSVVPSSTPAPYAKIVVNAAEAAIGLAILVIYYRNKASVEVEDINTLKG